MRSAFITPGYRWRVSNCSVYAVSWLVVTGTTAGHLVPRGHGND